MARPSTDTVISEVGRAYLRLQLTQDVGPARLNNLIAHFGSVEAVLSASMAALEGVEGIGRQIATSLVRARDGGPVDREIDRAAEEGLRIVCRDDDDYPQSLLHIPDPPICLYLRGHLEPSDCVSVSIVGTRRCSHYGREQAARFAESLARAGFTIVSGLARGIDGEAHRGAIRGGGRTLAVLGNGLAQVYPPEHESLAAEVACSGALISELPVDTPPDSKNFPKRNRIIAGLSLGVIVVEAGRRSGALITARLAAEYNREIFALPGRVDRPDLTAGVHALIRDGHAKLVTHLEDVLDELSEVGQIMRQRPPATAEGDPTEVSGTTQVRMSKLASQEQAVLAVVMDGVEEINAIRAKVELDMGSVLSTLTALQLKGFIEQLPGNRFVARRN